MTVRSGREFLAIPGPTTMPDEVLAAMHRPAIDIYAGPLLEITDTILTDLARLFRTSRRPYIYIANGHGAWEAALTNVLCKGDTVLVLESGRFAAGWGAMAQGLGCEVEVLPGAGSARSVPRPSPATCCRSGRPHQGGARRPGRYGFRRRQRHPRDRPRHQGSPARRAVHGRCRRLARLHAIRDGRLGHRCRDGRIAEGTDDAARPELRGGKRAGASVHERAGLRTPYWDWTAREGDEHYRKYAGTPPEHLLFGLRKALDMIFEEGPDAIFERHRLLAGAVQRALEIWAEGGALGFSITAPAERSNTVTAIRLDGDGRAAALLDYCNTKCGVVLGRALGDLAGCGFRIAHMGHVNAPMVLGTLAVVEMGLAALGIPHGKGGISAAIEWLAREVRA